MRAARQRASDVLDLVGLDEARFRPVEGFSTGMRQRTKLAQALVADPELVLLDEPTAGLDPIGREEMLALVGRLSTFGISVVLATHLLDDVQAVCDHVVMIDAGRLVLAGPTTQLLERAGTVRVDVGRSRDGLVDELARRGLAATVLDDASLEISGDGRSGDEVLDTVRDVVAQLGLPLHALSTRHASLDEVFLRDAPASDAMTATASTPSVAGAVYDRGYRPYEGALGGERARHLRALPHVDPPCPRHPPVVAAEGAAVDAAGHRHRAGHRQRRRRLRDPQHAGRGLQVHHLPGVRRRLERAPAVRRRHRSRRRVPGPAPSGAALDLRPTPRRPRLRAGQGGRHRHHPVRVQLPAPGRAVRRPDARERRRPRLPAGQRRRALEGAGGRRPSSPCTTRRSASRWPR